MHPQEEWSHGMQNPLVVLLFSYGHECLLMSYCKKADANLPQVKGERVFLPRLERTQGQIMIKGLNSALHHTSAL